MPEDLEDFYDRLILLCKQLRDDAAIELAAENGALTIALAAFDDPNVIEKPKIEEATGISFRGGHAHGITSAVDAVIELMMEFEKG